MISAEGQLLVLAKPAILAELIVTFSTLYQNDEARQWLQIFDARPNYELPDPLLYCYSSPHIGSLCNWNINSSRYTGRCRLGDDVKQYLTHFTCAGSDGISLFVLEGVNPAVDIQGQNHWFGEHLLFSPGRLGASSGGLMTCVTLRATLHYRVCLRPICLSGADVLLLQPSRPVHCQEATYWLVPGQRQGLRGIQLYDHLQRVEGCLEQLGQTC